MTKNKIAELPTDSFIENYLVDNHNIVDAFDFSEGAIWMRDTFAKPLLDENTKLKSQLALCVEALEIYKNASFDLNGKNYAIGSVAQECLDKIAAMQKEQKGE